MTPNTLPSVSIGLPVYNGSDNIARCLQSLLAQSRSDIEIIVSDNASTDNTGDIVAVFAARDERIHYHRQPYNIGADANFGFVLGLATADYFMWAADDDCWDPSYVEANASFLDANSDYVTSVSRCVFHDANEPPRETMGTYALSGTPYANLEYYLLNPGANSRFYGLHRTGVIRAAWSNKSIWGGDWLVMCHTLLVGKHHEIPQVLINRGAHGLSSNGRRAILATQSNWITRIFPMLKFSLAVLRLREVRYNLRLTRRLVALNWKWTSMMLRGGLSERVQRLRDVMRRE